MERSADPAMQLPIDEAILDYLLYTTIKTQLEHIQSFISGSLGSNQATVELSLELVDSFLVMFHCLHPDHHSSADLKFRLRLLKFATFSSSRFADSPTVPTISALQDIRKHDSERAKASHFYNVFPDDFNSANLNSSSDPKISNEQLPENGTSSNLKLYKLQGPTSLLDTLPDFMGLSAAQIMLQNTSITEVWMRLAAGYMSHAFAEQILVHRTQGSEILRQAFAWGFDEKSNAEEGSDELQISAMFLGDDGAVDGWNDLREAHMHALVPPSNITLQSHLRTLLANDLPSAVFEQHLLDFLWGLLDNQPKPLLVQIESGKIDGWTQQATELLKAKLFFP